MRQTEVEHLKNQIINLKSKLHVIETIVDKMGNIQNTGTKWTPRETMMFNHYTELRITLR